MANSPIGLHVTYHQRGSMASNFHRTGSLPLPGESPPPAVAADASPACKDAPDGINECVRWLVVFRATRLLDKGVYRSPRVENNDWWRAIAGT